jgi:hypothetical protein
MEASTLFVVRVWRQVQRGHSAFRASVRAVDVEQELLFTRSAALARYLDRASIEGQPPADPSPPTHRSCA